MMLKEEKELRNHISRALWENPGKKPAPPPKCCRDAITALVRAVREDCAKVADGFHKPTYPTTTSSMYTAPQEIAAAIRRKRLEEAVKEIPFLLDVIKSGETLSDEEEYFQRETYRRTGVK
ncbi:MAG: hypothetical protein WC763_07140 [Candidatus Paceibacterota bacterium]|jgi:hypothetical protein